MILALRQSIARAIAAAPLPAAQGVAPRSAGRSRIALGAANGLALVSQFTAAALPGWTLDFSRAENSGYLAAL